MHVLVCIRTYAYAYAAMQQCSNYKGGSPWGTQLGRLRVTDFLLRDEGSDDLARLPCRSSPLPGSDCSDLAGVAHPTWYREVPGIQVFERINTHTIRNSPRAYTTRRPTLSDSTPHSATRTMMINSA